MEDLEVRITSSGEGVPRIVVAGELDISSHEQLVGALAMVHEDEPMVLLDLSDVTFIDSTGLRGLLTMRAQRDAQRLQFVFSPACERLIDLTGVREVLLGERR